MMSPIIGLIVSGRIHEDLIAVSRRLNSSCVIETYFPLAGADLDRYVERAATSATLEDVGL